MVRIWRNRTSHLLFVEMKDIRVNLKDSLTVSYKTKHSLGVKSTTYSTMYLPN